MTAPVFGEEPKFDINKIELPNDLANEKFDDFVVFPKRALGPNTLLESSFLCGVKYSQPKQNVCIMFNSETYNLGDGTRKNDFPNQFPIRVTWENFIKYLGTTSFLGYTPN